MSGDVPLYEVVLGKEFAVDLMRLAAAAEKDPRGSAGHLHRQVLKQIGALAEGVTDGRHALGYEAGKGDLRDCVTAYLQSDPQQKADYRLVFREMPPAGPGGQPRRELLAVKPRQGSGNIYEHTCARLNRNLHDRQPGLNAFGDRMPSLRQNHAQRQAELDANRAIAHAFAGQVPLATSRPLTAAQFGRHAAKVAPRPAQDLRR
ncbi:hypothetical protein [Kribbella sindirgiensis]|uniref:Uncharacterized protein n=1 Tax=Kribbella sindirgiensis TaxID=1124744 RepID=A0A4R0IU41_9ACTN|nr:hypothetical protein [Kribbella sindirgiensis]TCC35046.1 hypothetical protein E0H50_14315 [Kribbella sindirgiensis]